MAETLNQRWSASLIGALVASGVKHFVVAPGSRSTPVTLAIADRPDVKAWPVMDERVAAFLALGLAKGSGQPVAVVCTSGTAGAHFLPAMIEASETGVPLIAVTADRPWELVGFGAAQTIHQQGLFGRFAREVVELPVPEDRPEVFAHLVNTIARAVSSGGTVHVNAPFREPLAPEQPGTPIDPKVTQFTLPSGEPTVDALIPLLERAERGVIICGPRELEDGFGDAVHALGAHLGMPVLAEATSNARYGFADAITAYDTLLRNEPWAAKHRPDLLLRFGGGLTPKTMITLSAPTVIQVCDGAIIDPSHVAQHVVIGCAVRTCEALVERTKPARSNAWRISWLSAERAVQTALSKLEELSEPTISRAMVAAIDGNLVLSSSMPIRDVDAFAPTSKGALRVFANRGVNGIDGVMSTALGISAATGRRTTLLIGDVAFLHDLGAWIAAKTLQIPLTVVLVNNDGGGIFHFLPVAGKTPHFERFFGTPHGVDSSHVAALAGAKFTKAETLAALTRALSESTGLQLIELRTNREQNVSAHRTLFAKLGEVLS